MIKSLRQLRNKAKPNKYADIIREVKYNINDELKSIEVLNRDGAFKAKPNEKPYFDGQKYAFLRVLDLIEVLEQSFK